MADIAKHHHIQQEVALNRPNYRESRWNRAVKVFTVNQESKYLLVMNVPSLGVVEELLALFRVYGEIEEYRILEEYPHEKFTDVFFFKYKQIDSARTAKRKLDNWYFFSRQLHVCYAPEFEMQEETREKLQQRRTVVAQKTSVAGIPHHLLPSGPGTLLQQPLPPPHSPIGSPQCNLQRFRHPALPVNPAQQPHIPSSPIMNPILLTQPPMIPMIPPPPPPGAHVMPPRPSMFVRTPSIPTNPPFIPLELHHRLHGQVTRPVAPPPSMLVARPHSRVLPPRSHVPHPPIIHRTTNQRNEVSKKVYPIQRPPPLISDNCPPPLISVSLTNTPPPLLSTASNVTPQSSICSSESRSVQSVAKPTRAGLSTDDRIKLHLEQEGEVDNTATTTSDRDYSHKTRAPVICQKQQPFHRDSVVHTVELPMDTPHIVTGKSNICTSDKGPSSKHAPSPVVSVQEQSPTEAINSRPSTTSITSDIQTGSVSVDSTVSSIRNKMTEIFKPCSPELQEPSAKKRKRI